MTGKTDYFVFEPDSLNYQVTMYTRSDTANKFLMHYAQPDSLSLQFAGVFQGDTLDILLKKIEPKDFLLVNRGFNWINEYPFNR